MLDVLAGNPLLLLFTVIGIGYLAGAVPFFGFRLGVAAVLFTGIAFGAMDTRLTLPENIYVIGLVLFVYSIGLQSGPSFFASFRRRGLRYSMIVTLLLVLAAVLTVILARLFKFSAPSAAGLFCGSVTNTPALAAAVEATKALAVRLDPGAREQFVSSPVVSFGLAYPFGVFGVILAIHLYQRLCKSHAIGVGPDADTAVAPSIASAAFRVTNPGVLGKTVAEALASLQEPGFILSRIRKEGRSAVVEGGTILEADDLVMAVGSSTGLARAELVFGELVPEELLDVADGITYRRIFVSNRKIVGKTLRELHLGRTLHATVTRLRRGEADVVPTPDTVLEMGDRIRVVTHKDNMDTVTRFFGDSVRSIAETDFLSISLGIVLGVFLGSIPLPLGNGHSFRLGFAGGPLIAGLVLGRLGRTGPIIWDMPYNANLVLRQIGLVFFLAGIGTRAGLGFVETLRSGGWNLVAAGALITTLTTLAVLFVGHRVMRLPMEAVTGMLSGFQTQPAVLAYANQQVENDLPNTWYAIVYPAAMVIKIILAQIIVSLVLAP